MSCEGIDEKLGDTTSVSYGKVLFYTNYKINEVDAWTEVILEDGEDTTLCFDGIHNFELFSHYKFIWQGKPWENKTLLSFEKIEGD